MYKSLILSPGMHLFPATLLFTCYSVFSPTGIESLEEKIESKIVEKDKKKMNKELKMGKNDCSNF